VPRVGEEGWVAVTDARLFEASPAVAVVTDAEVGAGARSGLEEEEDDDEEEFGAEGGVLALVWLLFFPTVPPTAPPMTAAIMTTAMRVRMIFARVVAQKEVVRL